MTISRMTTMAAMMGWTVAALAQSGQPQQKLTVYVENRAQATNVVLFRAEALATRMFAEIGIGLVWRKGKPAGSSSEPVIVMELVANAPEESSKPNVLAHSLVFEGVHTTLFYDRIEAEHQPGAVEVLAHVMVHEITHLLQGIDRHSDHGVMKALWTTGDFSEMAHRPLAFTALDVELIELGLKSRAAQKAAVVPSR